MTATVDIHAIRDQLGDVASATTGFTKWAYEPDDPKLLPAAVVGAITNYERQNRKQVAFDIGVSFYVSLADPADANLRLDTLLSIGATGSFIDALDAVTTAEWSGLWVTGAGPYLRVLMPGGGTSLACEVHLHVQG